MTDRDATDRLVAIVLALHELLEEATDGLAELLTAELDEPEPPLEEAA